MSFREDNELLLQLLRGPFGKIYVAVGILTLSFEWHLRGPLCDGLDECTLSFLKALVWAVFWPVWWWGYYTDFVILKMLLGRPLGG
jgi:hypothetical protein